MAQIKLDVKDTERKVSGRKGVEVTDEIYEKLSKASQTLICIAEKFTDAEVSVIEYANGYGVADSVLDAIIQKFKLG